MLNTSALSLEQAPPIGVPYVFFLSAPWFAGAAGIALAWFGPDLLVTRWAPATLAATHLLGLGFLSLVIVGALFQLLPVLAGAPVPRVVWVSRAVYGLWILGIPLLVTGFLTSSMDVQLTGLAPLGGGVLILVVALVLAVRRAASAVETVRAVGLSAAALLVVAGLGAVVLLALNARVGLMSLPAWVDLHLSWALLGWSGLLLVGIGVQLVPLFHVTPPYPPWFVRVAPAVVFGALLVVTAGHLRDSWVFRSLGVTLALAVFVAFAVLTLRLQAARRRPVFDPTLAFWWLGLGCLLGAVMAWLVDAPGTVVGVLALAGAGVAVPSGVLYKVVPFLAWFHLQAIQLDRARFDVALPHMKSLVSDRAAYTHFAFSASAMLLLLAALAGWEVVARPAGLLFAAASVQQGINLLRVYLQFRGVRAKLLGAV